MKRKDQNLGILFFKVLLMCIPIEQFSTLFSNFKPDSVYNLNWGLDSALHAQIEFNLK